MRTKINSCKGTILIADSCAGGLDVLRYFLDWAGEYELCFLADGKRNPLGLKNKAEIKGTVINWIKGFQKRSGNLALVVIACNTASIAVLKEIESINKKFGIPIVTMVDGVKRSLIKNFRKINKKGVLVTGTKYTINSGEYQRLLNEIKPRELHTLCVTKTERFIARGLEKDKNFKKEVVRELSKYKNRKIETIFLGCTCLEFARVEMRKLYRKDIFFLNPSIGVSEKSKEILNSKRKRKSLDEVKVYTTGDLRLWEENINLISRRIWGKKLKVKKMEIE